MSFINNFNEQNPNNSVPPATRNLNASISSRYIHIKESYKVTTTELQISKDSVTVIRPHASAMKSLTTVASVLLSQ